ncbi:ABC transporter permease [Chitinophaga oryzae]|uniref:ABC transporter permease n=1 Tax=Chitinophaga oryzae TaxID=2725414 RepID=A0AAE6ZJ78_9BACT|nr:ABC transporter permease [Chitinophaga oryzae]QJB34221.1 ABC transporter permease [Chitinophaga oryzae]QJB40742.1 ABC transporter permease [Chitinophaga oryzae]
MWKNYFKIAVKNLLKRKLYAGINVFGLATAIACFVLLSLYLENEWTYDRWYKNVTELYRLRMDYGQKGEKPVQTALTPNILATAIKDQPEIEKVVRVYHRDVSIQYKDKSWNEKRFLYADAPFFQLFSFPLKAGNAATVLSGPDMVVISASMAKKYFGDTDPVGKTLLINGKRSYQVTGVAADAPSNTHLKFDFVASYSTLQLKEYWGSANYYTYVQVQHPAQLSTLQASLTALARQQLGDEERNSGASLNFVPERVADIHLHSVAADVTEAKGDMRYNYVFALIGGMLLIIACVNFMNLATARSTERSREVGVRKALGAQRGQLFWQFMMESALLTGIALGIGLLLARLLLPAFNQLADVQLQMGGTGGYRIYMVLAVIFVLVSFVTGIYPALFLSGFRPVQVLKGSQTAPPRGRGIRQSLVVFQFAASIFFIICTLVVQQQMQYIQHKKLGLDRSEVLALNGFKADAQVLESFKGRLLQLSGVTHVTASAESPVDVQGGYSIDHIEGRPASYTLNINALPVEKDYLKTLGITLLSGEDLTHADIADILKEPSEARAYHFFLNETAVKKLGWTPEAAVGKRMMLNGREGTVKGVVKDFHFASMKSKIEPIVVFPEYDWFQQIYVKTGGSDKQQVIAAIGALWKEVQPATPFDYHFLDDDFNRMYKSEYRVGAVLGVFATLVMIVSCLGLLGLAALTTQQRTREIGIRKVLGASVTNVVAMLSKDFIRLVLLALLLAVPVAWYVGRNWLDAFAYHASLSVWLFVAAGALAIVVALLTVSLQSVKTATMNPVKSLRAE